MARSKSSNIVFFGLTRKQKPPSKRRALRYSAYFTYQRPHPLWWSCKMPSRVQGRTSSWNIETTARVRTGTSLASSTRPNEQLGVQSTIAVFPVYFLTLWENYSLSLSSALSHVPILTVLTLLITVLAFKVHWSSQFLIATSRHNLLDCRNSESYPYPLDRTQESVPKRLNSVYVAWTIPFTARIYRAVASSLHKTYDFCHLFSRLFVIPFQAHAQILLRPVDLHPRNSCKFMEWLTI